MYKETQFAAQQRRERVFADIQRNNDLNRAGFSFDQAVSAQQWADELRSVYGTRVWVNYRRKWISVKVEAPTKEQRDSAVVRNLDWTAANRNMTIVKTPKGVIYRMI
jgi:hypothetical protein